MPIPLALSQFDSFSLCFFFSLLSFCTVVLYPLLLNLSKWRLTPSQWGRAGAIFFYTGIKIFQQIVGIFHQQRGVPFSIRFQRIFTHQLCRNIF